MNCLKARQVDPSCDRPDAARWRYTTANPRGGTYAVGYCSALRPCPDGCITGQVYDQATHELMTCAGCAGKGYVRVADPCPGHDTADEAAEHYRQYLLTERLDLTGDDPDTQHHCQVCDAWTSGYATLDGWHQYHLCDMHRTRDNVSVLFGPVGESWES